MGVFSSLLTRIQSCESVSRSTSSFGCDLDQIRFMMRHSDSEALLLIDEFGTCCRVSQLVKHAKYCQIFYKIAWQCSVGKGTNALDGMALLVTTLNHFATKGNDCPLILATTHFG